jgi:hypothetical protein
MFTARTVSPSRSLQAEIGAGAVRAAAELVTAIAIVGAGLADLPATAGLRARFEADRVALQRAAAFVFLPALLARLAELPAAFLLVLFRRGVITRREAEQGSRRVSRGEAEAPSRPSIEA